MSLILVFNKNLPRAHTESELGMLWCSRKACEICSSLVQKKKLIKKYFSSHKLPKQQSTKWSQGILGVNIHFGLLFDIFIDMIHNKKSPSMSKLREGFTWEEI
jgi:hypothetical protein